MLNETEILQKIKESEVMEKREKIATYITIGTNILYCGTCIFAMWALYEVAKMVFGY